MSVTADIIVISTNTATRLNPSRRTARSTAIGNAAPAIPRSRVRRKASVQRRQRTTEFSRLPLAGCAASSSTGMHLRCGNRRPAITRITRPGVRSGEGRRRPHSARRAHDLAIASAARVVPSNTPSTSSTESRAHQPRGSALVTTVATPR